MVHFVCELIILTVVAVASLVGGATYAFFSNKVTSGPNTFATGNADLKIAIDTNKDGVKSDWQDDVEPWDQYMQDNWQDLYPGWEDSYWIYLKNDSSSPITLKVLPTVDITSYSTGYLWDEVFMEITWLNGTHSTNKYSLRAWRENASIYLEPTLAQGADDGPWVVKFSIPTTAGNEIADQEIVFDLIFDGIQQP